MVPTTRPMGLAWFHREAPSDVSPPSSSSSSSIKGISSRGAPLEVAQVAAEVDVIDIEDEDHSFASFFVGLGPNRGGRGQFKPGRNRYGVIVVSVLGFLLPQFPNIHCYFYICSMCPSQMGRATETELQMSSEARLGARGHDKRMKFPQRRTGTPTRHLGWPKSRKMLLEKQVVKAWLQQVSHLT